jgi:hypothetical protein
MTKYETTIVDIMFFSGVISIIIAYIIGYMNGKNEKSNRTN